MPTPGLTHEDYRLIAQLKGGPVDTGDGNGEQHDERQQLSTQSTQRTQRTANDENDQRQRQEELNVENGGRHDNGNGNANAVPDPSPSPRDDDRVIARYHTRTP